MKELLSGGKNRCSSLTEDCTRATQPSPWALASRGERCWQWSPDTGITTQLSTGSWAWAFENCRCLALPPAENIWLWEAALVFCGVGITVTFCVGFMILTTADPPYPWVLHLQIQPSVDWTCSKKHVLLHVLIGPWNTNRLLLPLFPQTIQPNDYLHSTFIALGIISNLEML